MQLHFHLNSLPQDATLTNPFPLSLLCFRLQKPEDSWPICEDWLTTAQDIWGRGYESHREPIEIRSLTATAGEVIGCGQLTPNKGFGRVSILLFGILFTYMELWSQMSAEEVEDFTRLLGTCF